jgi:hypothetical protein
MPYKNKRKLYAARQRKKAEFDKKTETLKAIVYETALLRNALENYAIKKGKDGENK